jgi:hypothetical protein
MFALTAPVADSLEKKLLVPGYQLKKPLINTDASSPNKNTLAALESSIKRLFTSYTRFLEESLSDGMTSMQSSEPTSLSLLPSIIAFGLDTPG